jgi:hypothetical protein
VAAISNSGDPRDTAERLSELLAKQEIHEAILRYFRGVDRCDAELITSAFHPDAVIEHGGHTWLGNEVGSILATMVRNGTKRSTHVVGNHLIEVDGSVASSETYMVCYLLREDERGEYLIVRALRYIDRFDFRDGAWKVAHRWTIREWDRIDRITERPSGSAYFEPSRSHDDLSYQQI